MDPIIFTISLGNFHLPIRWYGILIMGSVLLGTWIATREVMRRDEDPEFVWDALVYVLIGGILGARLWYVINDILGGGKYFVQNPLKIFLIPEGGLHIYGAILVGGLVAFWYARRNNIDIWLILDSVAPALLVAQATARPANFINQELYGPPTDLPWGISIDAAHRIGIYTDLQKYPVVTTRFHPTFAYEMIWNLCAAGLLLWLSHRYKEKLKPGTIFAGWLILAGIGRFVIEFFRPDQPVIPGTMISYTRVVAGLMSLIGVAWILVRYEKIKLPALNIGPDEYAIRERTKKPN